jgi:hypothetical protein
MTALARNSEVLRNPAIRRASWSETGPEIWVGKAAKCEKCDEGQFLVVKH